MWVTHRGGFMTFSGLTLVVRLMCLIFSWNEFHEIAVSFFLAPTVSTFS